MEHAGVNRGGQEVVGRCDGVDVTSQVQIELIHGDNLAVATAGGTTLDAKGGTLAGLAHVGKGDTADMGAQSLGQTHGCGGLAFSERCRGDASHHNVAAITAVGKALEKAEVDLGLVGAIGFQLRGGDTDLLGDLCDGLRQLGAGDGDIRGNGLRQLERQRNNMSQLLRLESLGCRVDDVVEKHGDRHGADAAGDGGDVGGNLGGRLEVDIAHQALARLLCGVGDVVGAHINDDHTRLELVAFDEGRASNCDDHDISILEILIQALGLGVADGDGGIGVLQEIADGAADDVAPPKDDGVLASKVNTGLLEENHDALGGAGDEKGVAAALGQLADVVGAEAVDILLAGDGRGDVVLGDALGERQLHEDTVHGRVVVEGDDTGDQLGLGGRLIELDELARNAALERSHVLDALGPLGELAGVWNSSLPPRRPSASCAHRWLWTQSVVSFNIRARSGRGP